MNVERILATKGSHVVTVSPKAPIAEAVALLAANRVGALVVSEDGTSIEGIISERDIVGDLAARPGGSLDAPVASIMSSEVRTCHMSDEIEALMEVMTEHRIRHVPVVREGRLAGIVSIGDVVKSRIGELEHARHELLEYIGAR
ncbi:MAG: CBS domain-containing protein [Actinomycetota bacterium]|jgi:CBS domain-containing protein|nr:CBS domain-containing protein [Actinomycetota bacterium]